jgi:hypothetical protein
MNVQHPTFNFQHSMDDPPRLAAQGVGRFFRETENWFLDKMVWHRIQRAEVFSVSGIFQVPNDAIRRH